MGAEILLGIVHVFIFISLVVLYLAIIIRFIKNRFAPVKSVEAVVIDKQMYTQQVVNKIYFGGDRDKYVVTFSAEGKKLMFYVSVFSYEGYNVGEKGILEYKGNMIVDFNVQ